MQAALKATLILRFCIGYRKTAKFFMGTSCRVQSSSDLRPFMASGILGRFRWVGRRISRLPEKWRYKVCGHQPRKGRTATKEGDGRSPRRDAEGEQFFRAVLSGGRHLWNRVPWIPAHRMDCRIPGLTLPAMEHKLLVQRLQLPISSRESSCLHALPR